MRKPSRNAKASFVRRFTKSDGHNTIRRGEGHTPDESRTIRTMNGHLSLSTFKIEME
jgi:hypothetical protein